MIWRLTYLIFGKGYAYCPECKRNMPHFPAWWLKLVREIKCPCGVASARYIRSPK